MQPRKDVGWHSGMVDHFPLSKQSPGMVCHDLNRVNDNCFAIQGTRKRKSGKIELLVNKGDVY